MVSTVRQFVLLAADLSLSFVISFFNDEIVLKRARANNHILMSVLMCIRSKTSSHLKNETPITTTTRVNKDKKRFNLIKIILENRRSRVMTQRGPKEKEKGSFLVHFLSFFFTNKTKNIKKKNTHSSNFLFSIIY